MNFTTSIESDALKSLGEMSNWGRWGDDDERGAANLVTPEVTQKAAGLVRQGRVFALGEKITEGAPGLPNTTPSHYMKCTESTFFGDPVQESSDALFFASMHGGTTHVDALCHMGGSDGRLFNGVPDSSVTSHGAKRFGIENLGAMITRGILLDIPANTGADALEAGHLITAEDLEAAAARAGVSVEPGDAVLIRTGLPLVYATEPEKFLVFQPGLSPSGALYLAQRDVVLIGSDNVGVEAVDFTGASEASAADERVIHVLHPLLLTGLGIHLLELLNLEELAAAGVTEFQFCLAPLKIEGGTCSPVNPIAVC